MTDQVKLLSLIAQHTHTHTVIRIHTGNYTNTVILTARSDAITTRCYYDANDTTQSTGYLRLVRRSARIWQQADPLCQSETL